MFDLCLKGLTFLTFPAVLPALSTIASVRKNRQLIDGSTKMQMFVCTHHDSEKTVAKATRRYSSLRLCSCVHH
ncbi:hypothetical protein F4604DRAFT_1771464 [Suillus subluteus]|nr:hypothetical protein F4604DRAFT_1771464 [Suillus subluteus]